MSSMQSPAAVFEEIDASSSTSPQFRILTDKTTASGPSPTPNNDSPGTTASGPPSKSDPAISFTSDQVKTVSDARPGSDGSGDNVIPLHFTLANDSVLLQNLTWYVDPSEQPAMANTHDLKELASAPANATSGDVYQEYETGRSGSIMLKIGILEQSSLDFGKPMVLGLNWTVNGVKGYTRSPAFSVVESEQLRGDAEQLLQRSPYHDGLEKLVEGGGHGGSTSNNPNPPNDNSTRLSGQRIDGSHGGSLSTGAIVGIAVGVGVAALLAAALGIFFFVRRRKSRRRQSAAALDQTHAEQEKLSSFPKDEGRHGNASDPALTPYQDDSLDRGRGGVAAHEGDAAAVPLEQPRATHEENHSRNATPHGVSRHLVEEGMTEDEIRRLEEEEAHLDSEIQRAGGGRR